jgi:hypothetical protein
VLRIAQIVAARMSKINGLIDARKGLVARS